MIRILFMCSSLEPGLDGVGDYTRRLSGELIRQGHKVTLIALNDRHINSEEEKYQHSEGIDILTYRLPSKWNFRRKFTRAKQWVTKFNPQWISLQFVLFGFQKKGLTFGLSRFLQNLGKERRWEIMFHELWVGMDEKATLKYLCWSWLQRLCIQSLVTSLSPKVVHTQSHLYQLQLAKIAIGAKYLPLFGNIPLIKQKNIFNHNDESKSFRTDLNFVIFGSIHPGSPIEMFAKEVAQYGNITKTDVKLTLIGHSGAEQNHWISVWQSVGLPVEVLGDQPPERVSDVLSAASIGITTTPLLLLEKSGSVAAMREHNLPVLCVSRAWYPRGFRDIAVPNGFFEYQAGNLHSLICQKLKHSQGHIVSDVAHQFLSSLSIDLY